MTPAAPAAKPAGGERGEAVGTGAYVLEPARFPGRAPIDAYGNGGFRFADMSHRGSILVLPSAIEAWPVASADEITPQALDRIVAEASSIEILLLGCGGSATMLSPQARQALEQAGLQAEIMPTGAAVRTFNVLLSEGRAVAAALIAVQSTG